MSCSRLSVTLPSELLQEVKQIASERKIQLSHWVAEAIREKTQRYHEEALLQKLNQVFEDDEIRLTQSQIAESIADNTDTAELPW